MFLNRVARRHLGLISLIALAVLFTNYTPAIAQVKPGDFIGPDNAAKVKDLVSPGVYYKLVNGMTIKVAPTGRIDWPPPYQEATEKYSAQVRLSQDHRSLVGYVAGQPFPSLDPNDPFVGSKIMWNNVFRPISSDDYDLRFYDCESVYGGRNKAIKVIQDWQIGHYAGYNLVGRTEVEPIPTDPDFKATGRLSLFGLYPIVAPTTNRGAGFIRYRYADPNRGDDSWSYTPGQRRIRRLNESILSSATASSAAGGSAVTAWNPDHYSGFNAKVEQYDYKFLGEKSMLASVHAEHSPEVTCPTDGGASACPETWELRRVYIVEATPRRDVIPEALQSKTIVYMDAEMWFPPYIDEYDRSGQLWYNHIWWNAYRDRPVPDAKVAIYPFKREFEVGALSTDVQSGLSTMCYLPGKETPEREAWYVNMGAVDREFFTIQGMVRAAQTGH